MIQRQYKEFLYKCGEAVKKDLDNKTEVFKAKDSHKLLSYIEVLLNAVDANKTEEVLSQLDQISRW